MVQYHRLSKCLMGKSLACVGKMGGAIIPVTTFYSPMVHHLWPRPMFHKQTFLSDSYRRGCHKCILMVWHHVDDDPDWLLGCEFSNQIGGVAPTHCMYTNDSHNGHNFGGNWEQPWDQNPITGAHWIWFLRKWTQLPLQRRQMSRVNWEVSKWDTLLYPQIPWFIIAPPISRQSQLVILGLVVWPLVEYNI